MTSFTPINFQKWINDNRAVLKPPVGNKMVYEEYQDFVVMVVVGTNTRKDFHYDPGEELFYQLEGDIILRIHDGTKIIDMPIKQGDLYLLPPNTPHSPQRPANTVGLVIERKRANHENDAFQWYCEKCGNKLYEEFLHVTNLVTQLPPIFERFYTNKEHTKCKKCGAVMQAPQKAK